MSGTCVLLSGGVDSVVALAWAQRHMKPVKLALHFSYGQAAERPELHAAFGVASYYGTRFRQERITMPHGQSRCPLHTATDEALRPGRNPIFLAYAGAICESEGIDNVVIGAHYDDLPGSRCTCRLPKMFMLQWVVSDQLGLPASLHVPFATMTKRQVIELGRQLNAPLHLAWSCYRDGAGPCGVCSSCKARMEAEK